jgi:hypothetical protein
MYVYIVAVGLGLTKGRKRSWLLPRRATLWQWSFGSIPIPSTKSPSSLRGISALKYTLQLPTEDGYLMTGSELLDRRGVLGPLTPEKERRPYSSKGNGSF